MWDTTFPQAVGIPGRMDLPVGVVASGDKVYAAGSIVPAGASTGTVFAVAQYSVLGPPNQPLVCEALATWPPTARNDATLRNVKAMTYVTGTDRVVVVGDFPSAATGARAVATVCFGRDLQGFFGVLWSRIEEDWPSDPPTDDEAVAITSSGQYVGVVARSRNYGTGLEMVVHCYDADTGSKTMPSQRWTSAGVQDDVAAGVAIIVANQGLAIVVSGTSPIGEGRTKIVLAAWQAAIGVGTPWPAGTFLGSVSTNPLAPLSDRAVAQGASPEAAQAGVFTAVGGVREDPSNPQSRDYIVMAASAPCNPCTAPSLLNQMWLRVWDHPAPGQQPDESSAITSYSVSGGDIPASLRVAVTGTTVLGTNGTDIHTVALHGGTGCPEWFGVENNPNQNLNDFPLAISSMDTPLDPAPYRRLAITGGTTKSGGNIDLFNISYPAEPEFAPCGSPPTLPRLPHFAESPQNWTRPDGDNFDAGIGVHITAIGGPGTSIPYQRGLFVATWYIGNTVSDEWVLMRIVP